MDPARLIRRGLLLTLVVIALGGSWAQGPTWEQGIAEARAHLDAGEYAEAELVALDALVHAEAGRGEDSLEVARLLDIVSESLIQRGEQVGRALELTERSVRIREVERTEPGPGLAQALWLRGRALEDAGRLDEAEAALERALSIREDHDDGAATTRVLMQLVSVESTAGHFDKALGHARREAELIEALHGDSDPELARSLYTLARTTVRVHGALAALPIYKRALEVGERAFESDSSWLAWLLNGLAIVQDDSGDWIDARRNYERALGLAWAELGPNHPVTTACLNNLGALLTKLGDYPEALRYYEDALRLDRERSGGDTAETARVLSSIAEIHHRSGDLVEAEAYYREAFSIAESDASYEARVVEGGRWRLAALLTDLGRLEEAEREFERSVSIFEEHFEAGHDVFCKVLGSRGRMLARAGRWDEAIESYDQALRIAVENFGASNPLEAAALIGRAIALTATGRSADAYANALSAENIVTSHLRDTAGGLSERQALGLRSKTERGVDVALSILAMDPDAGSSAAGWDELVRSRAIVLDVTAARWWSSMESADPDIARLRDAYIVATRRLANLSVRGAESSDGRVYRVKLDAARHERERIERELAARDRQFGALRESANVGLDAVRARLTDKATLVAYVVFDKREWTIDSSGKVVLAAPTPHYAAWIATRQRPPRLAFLGEARRVDRLVSAWSREASSVPEGDGIDAESICRDAAMELRRAVWDPLALDLTGIEQLYVVPDGALHLVNFSALPDPDGGYLVERGPLIHAMTAERDLVQGVEAAPMGRGILIAGGVEFGEAEGAQNAAGTLFRGSCLTPAEFRSVRFPDLPATAEESAAVAAAWRATHPESVAHGGGSLVELTGSAATESRVKQEAPGKRVLHLATHGFFLGSGCTSAKTASRGIGALSTSASVPDDSIPEDPYHLAGLALAGSNRRDAASIDREDGILTAAEIAVLDLSGVDLAVLSACDTGAGVIAAGEGVLGLRRALQTAGVGTSVISLWSVDDEVTRRFMEKFYGEYFGDAQSPSVALRSATQSWLATRRELGRTTHPFYWGSWIAVGL